jgi:heme exporter protein A
MNAGQPQMPEVWMKAQGLSKSYGPKPVFKDVDFQVSSGQVVVVAGANGSGKSTLLKILAGVLPPTSGRVDAAVTREEIGYLGHETFLYPHLTVLENLSFWMRLYTVPMTSGEPEALLKRFGLSAVLYEPASTLSRGMAQKLSLARMLAIHPKVLLMDEPSTGLDSEAQALLHREILQARETGRIVFWVSHSPEADARMADGVLVLKGGRAELRMQCEGRRGSDTAVRLQY